jgi:hypothetical protein
MVTRGKQIYDSSQKFHEDINSTYNVNIELDGERYAKDAGEHVGKEVARELKRQDVHLKGITTAQHVSRSMGGRH